MVQEAACHIDTSVQASGKEEMVMPELKSPQWGDRPLATPSSVLSPGAVRYTMIAEMWLRLSRIALLELTKIPPQHRLLRLPGPRQEPCTEEGVGGHYDNDNSEQREPNKWMNVAFPGDSCDHANTDGSAVVDTGLDEPVYTAPVEPVWQAWARVIMRVMDVTGAGPGPPPGPGSPDECRPPNVQEGMIYPPPNGHANICLGDLMEESISWLEVDEEDDQHTPKAADKVQIVEEEEEGEAEEAIPSCLKDVYRQQKAPGLVAGMQKCLSFC
jgi:hypothetical protein